MRAVRASALILATGLALSSWTHAQTAPEIALPAGDAARGKAIFENSSKGNCLSCHRVKGVGSLFGPDLSAIAAPPGARGGGGGGGGAPRGAAPPAAPALIGDAALNAAINAQAAAARGAQANAPAGPTPQQFAQSIVDPNAVVSVQNRYVVLKMKDGKTITGKLLSIDTFYIQIFNSSEKLENVSKENVREMTMTSPMPSYRDKLTTQELSDVVSYLMSLRGQ